MFGKFLLISFMLLTACSKPKYVRTDSPQRVEVGEQKPLSCDVKLGASKYCVQLLWQQDVVARKYLNLVVKIYRENAFDQSPVLVDVSEQLEVIPYMSSMGHGSGVDTLITRLDVGTFLVEEIFFTMTGPWEIFFKFYNSGELVDEAEYSISIH